MSTLRVDYSNHCVPHNENFIWRTHGITEETDSFGRAVSYGTRGAMYTSVILTRLAVETWGKMNTDF